MKLIKAQIVNFKSIEDSEEFKVADDVTCLVGKNESGKTALLTALYRLNPIFDNDAKFDREPDYPRRFLSDYEERHPEDEANVVTTWWKLEDADKELIAEALGPAALTSDEVTVTKGYENTLCWTVHLDKSAVIQHLITHSSLSDTDRAALAAPKTVKDLKVAVTALAESAERTAFIHRLDQALPEGSVVKGALKVLTLPKFMLFSQYQRMEGEVSLEKLLERKAAPTPNDQVFLALCEMAGTTLEAAASIQKFESLIAKFEGASNKISRDAAHRVYNLTQTAR